MDVYCVRSSMKHFLASLETRKNNLLEYHKKGIFVSNLELI